MYDDRVRKDCRPMSEIVAEAREVQGREASCMLKAAARRLRGVLEGVTGERTTGERASFEARQFTLH